MERASGFFAQISTIAIYLYNLRAAWRINYGFRRKKYDISKTRIA